MVLTAGLAITIRDGAAMEQSALLIKRTQTSFPSISLAQHLSYASAAEGFFLSPWASAEAGH